MNEYVDQVRDAFTAQAAGDLEPARRLLRPDAVLNIPAFLPVADPRGFDGMVALLLAMASRCDGGSFASRFIDAIGAGRVVTTINEVDATRNGADHLQHLAPFPRRDGAVAEAWLHLAAWRRRALLRFQRSN